MKKRLLTLALAALPALLAAADNLYYSGRVRFETPETVFQHPQDIRPIGDRIRIASYNCQDFYDGAGEGTNCTPEMASRHARDIAALLDRISPDIVVLEEVENDKCLSMLNAELKPPYPVGAVTRFAAPSGEEQKLNIAVLSRVPLLGLRDLDFGYLRGPARPPRGVLCFFVELGEGRRLLVYGVHLKSNYGKAEKNRMQRYYGLRLLRDDADWVRAKYRLSDWEMLVLGDMNVDPEDPQFAADLSLKPLSGWVDLWRGRPLPERVTLPRRLGDPLQDFPSVTFDRFFCSPELTRGPWRVTEPHVLQQGVDTNNIFTVPGQGDVHVSDHYPIWVDVVR